MNQEVAFNHSDKANLVPVLTLSVSLPVIGAVFSNTDMGIWTCSEGVSLDMTVAL